MRLRILCLLGAVVMTCLASTAQQSPEDKAAFREVQANHEAFIKELGMDEHELYDLIQSYMLVRLKKTLELTDLQVVELTKNIGTYQDRLMGLKFYKGLLVAKLRILLRESAPEASLQNDLTAILDIDAKTVKTLGTMITEAGNDLSVAQRAKLYLFVGDFEKELRLMALHAQRMNKEGHKKYTKEQHDRYHRMTQEEVTAFHELVKEKTSGLDIQGRDRKNLIELVDAWLMVRLSSELELTTEETVHLFARVGTHKDKFQAMKWQMSEARLELHLAAQDDSGDASIERQLDGILRREEAIVNLVRDFVTEAQKDVSTHRAAQLLIFIGDFEQEVIDLSQRAMTAGQ